MITLDPIGTVRGGRAEPVDDGWGRRALRHRAPRAVRPGRAGRARGVLPRRGGVPLPPRGRGRRGHRCPAAAGTTRLAGGRHLRPAGAGAPQPPRRDHVPPGGGRGSTAPRPRPRRGGRHARCWTSSPSCGPSSPRQEVIEPDWVGELMAGYWEPTSGPSNLSLHAPRPAPALSAGWGRRRGPGPRRRGPAARP